MKDPNKNRLKRIMEASNRSFNKFKRARETYKQFRAKKISLLLYDK